MKIIDRGKIVKSRYPNRIILIDSAESLVGIIPRPNNIYIDARFLANTLRSAVESQKFKEYLFSMILPALKE